MIFSRTKRVWKFSLKIRWIIRTCMFTIAANHVDCAFNKENLRYNIKSWLSYFVTNQRNRRKLSGREYKYICDNSKRIELYIEKTILKDMIISECKKRIKETIRNRPDMFL